jgi:cell division protein FtsB
MTEQFWFTLIEKLELMQRIRALETQNAALQREVERLGLQNELLRDDMRAFAESKANPRVLVTDRRGVVISN